MRALDRGALVLLLITGVACGNSGGRARTTAANQPAPRPSARIDEGERCEGGGTPQDLNGDGAPDVTHVRRGGREYCTLFDLNADGRPDSTRFFAPDGTVLRETGDFDFDNRIDQVAYYEAGRLVRRELDTDFDRDVDTWVWCNGPLYERSERDRGNVGHADTWETYQDGFLAEVRTDENNDGIPDRWEIFQRGRVIEARFDTDADGRPDRTEAIPGESAGPPEERASCDGTALPEAPPPTATPGESPAPPPEPNPIAPPVETTPSNDEEGDL